MNTLLNAMKLADVLEVDFRFTWPHNLTKDEHHAIVPADQFFSPDFLVHMVDHRATASGYSTPAGPKDDLDSLRVQLAAAERGLLAPGRALETRIDPDAVPAIKRGFSDEFARLGFHTDIADAITAARTTEIGDRAVGIHLRAGDNLYGNFRAWTRYSRKAISASVARALIERYRAEGCDVVVFGQDTELIEELSTSTGALDGALLRPSTVASRPAEAMFDLVLLSQCERIIAGSSGFALQAAAISDQTVTRHTELFTPAEVLTLTRADLDAHGHRYSPTQNAFAWWTAYHEVQHEIAYDDAVELLGAGLAADPTNPRARIRLAALHYHHGHDDRGDDVLLDALTTDVLAGGDALESVMLLSQTAGGGTFDSAEIIDDVEQAAERGSGPATIYRAAVRARRGDADNAQADVASFRAHTASNDRLTGLDGLDTMAEATIAKRS